MTYQPRPRSSKKSGRRLEIPKHEKIRARAAKKVRRSSRSYVFEENQTPTSDEIMDRVLISLNILGKQIFALPPFYEHFEFWLASLRDVLSEFESSPAVSADELFMKERSQILSNLEHHLEESRREEASRYDDMQKISENMILLEQIEKEFDAKTKELEERKVRETALLSRNADDLQKELDHISLMKTGIFRALSKRAKAKKEAEATQRLNSAQRDLRSAVQHFVAEEAQLRDDYEKKKQPLLEQVRNLKRIDSQNSDLSLKDRKAACEYLANAVKKLFNRKNEENMKAVSNSEETKEKTRDDIL